MSNPSSYLEPFASWLKSLGADALEASHALQYDELPLEAQRLVVGALNYLFKSLDLIPDGVEDLGYLDDAFILRVAAALSLSQAPSLAEGEAGAFLRHLSKEANLISDFLGNNYKRLEAYAQWLKTGAARGRTVDEILETTEAKSAFLQEVRAWATTFEPPSFRQDEKILIKLQSFLDTKLPR